MTVRKDDLYTIRPYLIVFLSFWILAAILLFTEGYEGSFLLLNRYNTPFWDHIMPHLTHAGDSLILSALVLILISPRNLPLAIAIVISILASGLVLICFKQFIFPDWHRPLKVLGEDAGIHFIKGNVEYNKAFPSGHSTTIASAFPFFAYIWRKNFVQVIIAFVALVFCYTRIYLGSHFLGDVVAGTLLGSFFAITGLLIIYPKMDQAFSGKNHSNIIRYKIIALIVGLVALFIGLLSRYVF